MMTGKYFFILPLGAFAAAVVLLVILPKKLRIVLALLLAVCALVFCAAEWRVIRAARGNAQPGADYLIVLGCAVHGTMPSLAMHERCAAAAAYMLENPDCIAIVSGGRGPDEDITEAEVMAGLLERAGVPKERILLESKATSTLENLQYSVELAGIDVKTDRVIICSSEYHLYRAGKSAERLFGVSLETIPARPGEFFNRVLNYVREACGVIYLGMW